MLCGASRVVRCEKSSYKLIKKINKFLPFFSQKHRENNKLQPALTCVSLAAHAVWVLELCTSFVGGESIDVRLDS